MKRLLAAPKEVGFEDASRTLSRLIHSTRHLSVSIRMRWHSRKGILIEGEDIQVHCAVVTARQQGIIWDEEEA